MLYHLRGAAALLLLFTLSLLAQDAESPTGKGLEGKWLGTLTIKIEALKVDQKLRLLVHLEKKKDGYTGTLDSIDQGAKGIKIDTIEFKDGNVKMVWKALGASFEGKLNKEATTLTGTWKQGGLNLPLAMERTTAEPKLARPQEPKKPYPYREEEVTFENRQDKVKLAGTLTLPKGEGPFPAAVLISGSGPQDRDETILGHKPFLVLADHLTRQGIAVLRFDDRGVGGSTGSTLDSTVVDHVGDALAAVAFLRTRKEIDGTKIGLIGHSEGGIVAPLAATKSSDVAFVVMLAGSGLPGEQILYLQGRALLKVLGASDEVAKAQNALQKVIFDLLRQEKDNAVAKKKIVAAVKEHVEKLPEDFRKEVSKQLSVLDAQLQMVTTKWFRHFIDHDPRAALRQLKCPTLVLVGELDVQVPPKENLQAIRECLKEAGNKDATIRELPGLNHLFQRAKTGSVTEYSSIEETFNPEALRLISNWIVERFGKR